MSKPRSRRFPVTVSRLPVVRCEICRRTVAHRPGQASQVLTEHYSREHPDALGLDGPPVATKPGRPRPTRPTGNVSRNPGRSVHRGGPEAAR